MALNAAVVWEVQTGGSDNNGGGFKAGATGTDRSQQTAAQATLSASSVVHSTTTQINVAVGDFTVSAADVGNVVQVTGGTATAGFYEITAVDVPNNRWTVDRSVGTAAQTVVGAMGGCLASPGKASGAAVDGNTIYVKAGTYTISTATANASGGTFSTGVFTARPRMVGYSSNRTTTNTDTKPLIQFGAVASITLTNSNFTFYNLAIDGQNQTSARLCSGNGIFIRCTFTGFNTASTANLYIGCSATANSAAIFGGKSFWCEAYANTATPFSIPSTACAFMCLSYGNTGASTSGFSASGPVVNCVAYGNGQHGFSASANGATFSNCYAEGNAGLGYSSNDITQTLTNCGGYNNTSGFITSSSVTPQIGNVTLTATAFMNAAGNDFSLNTTASGGALLRAAGVPGVYPRGTTTGYLDIGAAQHADPAALRFNLFASPIVRVVEPS